MARIDAEMWTPFVKVWTEAAEAGMTPADLAALLGVNVNTLRGRQIALRKRGIMLPLLAGQRGPRGPYRKKKREVRPVSAAPKCSVESMVIYVM
jgi:hypothetical protein